jgi:hypothetical protein
MSELDPPLEPINIIDAYAVSVIAKAIGANLILRKSPDEVAEAVLAALKGAGCTVSIPSYER